MPVVVVEHDPTWADQAEIEKDRIRTALGELVVAIHHIGSTSIPDIFAKPILDFLLEVKQVELLDDRIATMEGLDYEAMGEYGIPRRRYFRKSNHQGIRTHHIHAFTADDVEVHKHLAFRDYLIAHPDQADAYGQLKRTLAAAHPDDIQAYMDGKDPFIKDILAAAMVWYESRGAD